MDDTDNPVIVTDILFMVQGRTRDECLAKADEVGNRILNMLGGEPWVMLDDDWQRVPPPNMSTLTDDQGFMYSGRRRYQFKGPFLSSVAFPEHHGFRTQKGALE